MMTLNIMRQTFKEWTLPDEAEVTWDINNNQEVTYAEKKFREYLADGWIAYSLGNFVFDQYFSEETMKGLILEVLIEGKEIKKVDSKEFKMTEIYQPKP